MHRFAPGMATWIKVAGLLVALAADGCAGGSGNGPNYVTRPVRVRPPEPFGLDRDGDGIGCES